MNNHADAQAEAGEDGEMGSLLALPVALSAVVAEEDRTIEQKPVKPPDLEHPKRVLPVTGKRMVGVRLQNSSMIYRLAANFPELQPGDRLLLQTSDGEVVGRVVFISGAPPAKSIDPHRLYPGRIVRIVRRLNDRDQAAADFAGELEKRAKTICRQAIRQLQLPMKLCQIAYQPGCNKAVFHFTAESRVDFRELVKILAVQLKVGVEMRHVGVRDETRLLGGLGPCGKDFCCVQYMQKFHPVSVRMAKNQDLSLNPEGISGVCGRLMCCLAFENDAYSELRQGLPKLKKACWTRGGREGIVCDVRPLSGVVSVQFADGLRENVLSTELLTEKPQVVQVVAEVHIVEDAGVLTALEGVGDLSLSSEARPATVPRQNAEKIEKGEAVQLKPRRRKKRRGKSQLVPQEDQVSAAASSSELVRGDFVDLEESLAEDEVVPATEVVETVAELPQPMLTKRNRRRRRRKSGQVKESPLPLTVA